MANLHLPTLAVVTLPLAGFIVAIISCWGWGIGWAELGLLLGMYVLTVLGITIGFHRLFSHRAFETGPVLQGILAIMGSMAIQGPLLKWVALHRRHHQHSDTEDDPHSPHQGHGMMDVLRGAWHSHVGWFFAADPPDLDRYIRDLRLNPLLAKISALFPLWVLCSLLIPALAGWLLTGTWQGALTGLLWGGLARIFLVHHVTWSVNSICHLWGGQTFKSGDKSRNNFLMGILALGEGWHNNHHAFPVSARHGLKWWQIDISYWIIRLLALLKLARKVRLPPPSLIASLKA